MNYYANLNKDNKLNQTLEDHIYYVTIRSVVEYRQTCEGNKSNVNESILIKLLLTSLCHDWGKVSELFQGHLKNKSKGLLLSEKDKKFKGPYHNEISFLMYMITVNEIYKINYQLIKEGIDLSYLYQVKNNTEKFDDVIPWGIYWHHKANVNKDGKTFVFGSLKEIKDSWLKLETKNGNKFYKNKFKDVFEITQNVIKRIIESHSELIGSEAIRKISSFGTAISRINLMELNPTNVSIHTELDSAINNGIPHFKFETTRNLNNTERDATRLLIMAHFHEADSLISSMTSSVPTRNLLQNSLIDKLPCEYSPAFLENQYSLKQISLTKKIVESTGNVSIFEMDPGSGKTIMALLCLNEFRKSGLKCGLAICLPQTSQVQKMYEELVKPLDGEVAKVFGNEIYNIQNFYSGEVGDSNYDSKGELYENADVTITIIDRVGSSSYERGRNSELINMIRNILVIDEYHTLFNLEGMVLTFRELIEARNLVGGKTVFLSGTPNTILNKILRIKDRTTDLSRKPNIINREQLDPIAPNKTYTIKYLPPAENLLDLSEVNELVKNHKSIVFHGGNRDRTLDMWRAWSRPEKDEWVASNLLKEDKENVLKKVISLFSKGSDSDDVNVFHPRLLSESLNISWNHRVGFADNAYMAIQGLGRVGRFTRAEATNHMVYFIGTMDLTKYTYIKTQQLEEFLFNRFLLTKFSLERVVTYREFISEWFSFYNAEISFLDASDKIKNHTINKSKNKEEDNNLALNFPKRSSSIVSKNDFYDKLKRINFKKTLRDFSYSFLIDGKMFIDSPKIESLANFERYISNLNSFEIKEFISAYSKHLSEEVSEKLLKELSKPQYEIRRNRQDFMVNIMGKFEEFPIVVEGRVSTIFNNPYFLVDIKQMGLFYKK